MSELSFAVPMARLAFTTARCNQKFSFFYFPCPDLNVPQICTESIHNHEQSNDVCHIFGLAEDVFIIYTSPPEN